MSENEKGIRFLGAIRPVPQDEGRPMTPQDQKEWVERVGGQFATEDEADAADYSYSGRKPHD